MAVQTRTKEMTLNGCHITILRTDTYISIHDDEGEVMKIE
ncbi:hypothetical protein HMPREF1230_0780 [Streptococcus pyogenes GA19681]|nr:hypothetical protein HMPREF1230_0780 [Streptococcus pyogenes GA19681]ESA49550.1 hypothetical protein HMPREF1235_0282 [Streptococcus pyogenes GA41208]